MCKRRLFDNSELDVEDWKKLKILDLHRTVDDKLIVFTNDKKEFDWIFNHDENNQKRNESLEHECITYITAIKTKDLNIHSWKIQKEFRELLSDALSNIYYCDYDNAKLGISKADEFISSRNREAIRTWSLVSTFLSTITILFICINMLINIDVDIHPISQLLIYSGFGSIGVFLASFMNLNKKNLQVFVGMIGVIIESIIHVFVGSGLAFFGLLLVKNNIILSFLDKLPFEHHEILISILFSCCESLFPRFIVKFENTTGEEIDAK